MHFTTTFIKKNTLYTSVLCESSEANTLSSYSYGGVCKFQRASFQPMCNYEIEYTYTEVGELKVVSIPCHVHPYVIHAQMQHLTIIILILHFLSCSPILHVSYTPIFCVHQFFLANSFSTRSLLASPHSSCSPIVVISIFPVFSGSYYLHSSCPPVFSMATGVETTAPGQPRLQLKRGGGRHYCCMADT